MRYLNTTCPLDHHHHNSFMATGALGHIHVHFTFYWHSRQLKSVQVTNKATSIINVEQQCGLKKHTECSNPTKLQ